MKLALVHDYLTQLGGAEKVLLNLQRVFSQSPVFVLVYNKNLLKQIFKPSLIRTSWLQRLPLSTHQKYYQWYLTLMPSAIESYKLTNYDIILSSASSLAKGVKKSENALHICYCHTPTRYLWHAAESYIEELGYNKLVKKLIPLFLERLKNWDLLAAQKVDYFIANSKVVQNRIKKYYGRESKVIYPPVEVEKFDLSPRSGNYYLIGGRLVGYKKYDLAIQTFNKLGIQLKIFGTGPDFKRLKKLARKNIEFLGRVSDAEKAKLYSECIAFIHPQVEDFGITAVEAMAAGRPVIAYFDGGALETVIAGQTGEFFPEQNWESLAHRIIHFQPEKYDSLLIQQHALKFNCQRFQQEIKDYVDKVYKDFQLRSVFKMK